MNNRQLLNAARRLSLGLSESPQLFNFCKGGGLEDDEGEGVESAETPPQGDVAVRRRGIYILSYRWAPSSGQKVTRST